MAAGEQMLLMQIRDLLQAILIHLRGSNRPLSSDEKDFKYPPYSS